MATKNEINHDLKEAMRARDKQTLEALRLIMAAIKQVEVDERIEVDEPRLVSILDKLAKQRQESITQFKTAGRTDLVAQEQFELTLIQRYLPAPLTPQDITALIEKALLDTNAKTMADMGKVMAELKPSLLGRADMSQISAMIKAKLT